MGTRYESGDKVWFGDREAEVLEVRNPDSNSPDYVLDFVNELEQPPEEYTSSGDKISASDLKKRKTLNPKEGQTVSRYEGEINGMDEYVMYRIEEVREDSYIVHRLGDDVGNQMEFEKEEFEEQDIRIDT